MSQDSIGVVTTGRGKLQEWKTTQKQNLSRKSRGTLTVKWAGSRDKIFSVSGRGRTFFLTSLFIELIDWVVGVPLCKQPSPVLGTLCAISISPIARYEFFVQLASEPYSEGVFTHLGLLLAGANKIQIAENKGANSIGVVFD